MAKGDLIRTKAPVPIVRYARRASGDTSVAGDPVGFNAAGEIVKAVNTTNGPIRYLTHLTKEGPANEILYGVLFDGEIETVAGAVINPFKHLTVNASSLPIVVTNETADDFAGIYIGKPTDEEGLPTQAAVNDPIIVRVGGQV